MVAAADPKAMELAGELFEECNISDGDRCALGLKFEKCLHSGITTRKIDADFF